MTKTQWALVSRRDENDELYSSWEQVEVEERPYRDDPFGRLFREERTRLRVTLAVMAEALETTALHVSEVERGVHELSEAEQGVYWDTLRMIGGERP